MDKLNAAKDLLSRIHPLRFRVELLENILSMLFLTNEDLQIDAETLSDSGEEYGGDTTQLSRHLSNESGNNSLNVSQMDSTEPVAVADASHFFSISDDNVMLWSDKTSSTNPSVDMGPNVTASLAKDPLLSMVKTYSVKDSSDQSEVSRPKSKGATAAMISDLLRKPSGSNSVTSTGSLCGGYKVGFLVNEFLVRDMLHILKECLVELNTTKFKLINGSKESSTDEVAAFSVAHSREMESLMKLCVESDVDEEKLQQRISKLQQCVSEASWRFQLAAHDWLPTQPGDIVVDLGRVQDNDEDWGMKRNIIIRVKAEVVSSELFMSC